MKKNHPVRRGTILSLVFWVLLGAILLGACGSQPEPSLDFYALERQTYESGNGYSIQFPAGWVLLGEDLESTGSARLPVFLSSFCTSSHGT